MSSSIPPFVAASLSGKPLKETIDRISSSPGSFDLVRSTPEWPLPLPSPRATQSSQSLDPAPLHTDEANTASSATSALPTWGPIHIAVLDSSFNPPTKAHQAIAFSAFPSPHPIRPSTIDSSSNTSNSSSSSSTPSSHPATQRDTGPKAAPTHTRSQTTAGVAYAPPEYNARLLLFSARNVEKTLDPTHATPERRVEMMSLLNSPYEGDAWGVGLINEPTFVGKAAIIRQYLSTLPHLNSSPTGTQRRIDLTFLIGTDTLIRFFDPRFYPPGDGVMEDKIRTFFAPYPEGSGAYLISARRGGSETDRAIEEEVLNRDGVKQWVEAGKLRLLGSGEEGWELISSTKVREAVKAQESKQVEELVGEEVMGYIKSQGLYQS